MEKSNYLYISGVTVYFVADVPEDGDYVHGSTRACHVSQVEVRDGKPVGYRPHFAVEGLYERVRAA